MFGIDILKISIKNKRKEEDIIINLNKKEAKYSEITFKIDEKQIKNIFTIIRNWNKQKDRIININAEKCIVSLYKDNKVIDKFLYQGSYPNNYIIFKNLIGEICKIY